MKNIHIIHNDTAGSGNHSKEKLLLQFKEHLHQLNYFSTNKNDWKKFYNLKFDRLIIAGGDGTIRKVALTLLEYKNTHLHAGNFPIHIIPLGTANNIAKSIKDFTAQTKNADPKHSLYTGKITYGKIHNYFFEGAGFGIFPELIYHLQEKDVAIPFEKNEIDFALEQLTAQLQHFDPIQIEIKIPDKPQLQGKFVMAEIMNIPYLGPNIPVYPLKDWNKKFLKIVLLPESNKAIFIKQLELLKKGGLAEASNFFDLFTIIDTNQLQIKTAGKMHIDDELVLRRQSEWIEISLTPTELEFKVIQKV